MQKTDMYDRGPRASMPAGALVMLILKTLSHGPLHGYAIAQEIKRASREMLHVEEGSLYPALQKMLAKGWVTGEWVKVGPRREARVYRLTAAGRRRGIRIRRLHPSTRAHMRRCPARC